MRFASLCLLSAALGFAAPAYAYLDPGTGSMIISAIVGIFATLALAIKTYWYKLVGLFRRKPRADAADRETATARDPSGD